MRNTGNQYSSRKATAIDLLDSARHALRSDAPRSRAVRVLLAQSYLALYEGIRATTPASTLRRWRCGK